MKPTGDAESDRAYSRAMGECGAFVELTDVMNQVKNEVQSRIEEEVTRRQKDVLGGAKGANDDKLRSGSLDHIKSPVVTATAGLLRFTEFTVVPALNPKRWCKRLLGPRTQRTE